jgi:membrane protease YdiL (CAAX protease family)
MVVNRFGTLVPAAPPSVVPTDGLTGGFGPGVVTPPRPVEAHGGIRTTGPLVAVAIGIGVLLQVLMLALDHNGRTEPATLIRYSLVGTLGLYLAVAVLLVLHLGRTGTRLRWTDGSPALGVITGLLVGGSLALVMLGLVKLVTGTATGDPRIVLLVSEGTADHILTAVAITVVAAPLVEEILFRGVLAESLRARGSAAAIWISAAAFSAWHLNPAALRYYAVMGALLGGLYWKRGLVSSMSAHAAFNGLLTLAAVLTATAPAHVVDAGGLRLTVPSGWTIAKAQPEGTVLTLHGPSGALLAVLRRDAGQPLDGAGIVARMQSMPQSGPFGVIVPGSIREQQVPAGDVARADLEVGGHRGAVVLIPEGTTLYELVVATAGSTKASTDFERILQSASAG